MDQMLEGAIAQKVLQVKLCCTKPALVTHGHHTPSNQLVERTGEDIFVVITPNYVWTRNFREVTGQSAPDQKVKDFFIYL